MKTHYAAAMIPALLVATVFGVARLGARFAYVVAVAALAGTVALGPVGRVDVVRTHTTPRRAARSRSFRPTPP